MYAGGPVSQVNSIIWPNPEFDNDLTVYGPEVKALVARYLDQMLGELGDLSLLDEHRPRRPPPGQQEHGHPSRPRRPASRPTASTSTSRRWGTSPPPASRSRIYDAVREGVIDRPMRVFTPAFGAGAVGGYTVIRVDPAIVVPEGSVEAKLMAVPDGNVATTLDDVRAAFGG